MAVVVACLLGSSFVVAQEVDTDEAAAAETEAFVKAGIEFTSGVRLTEKRVARLLANLESLGALKDEREGRDLFDRVVSGPRVDFHIVLADPGYVAWCAKHHLDAADFFKSLMRLELLTMRRDVAASAAELERSLPAQRKEIERLRGTLGESAYRESVASLDASVATFKRIAATVERIPQPDPTERALLAKYGTRLSAALGDEPQALQP